MSAHAPQPSDPHWQGATPYVGPPPYPQAGAAWGQQPGYGQQPYGYAPYPHLSRPTNTMAILALVFAFVFAPLGIVFGVMARNQIRQTGEGGDGLALSGLIVGAVFTALFVLYIVFIVVMIGAAVSAAPTT